MKILVYEYFSSGAGEATSSTALAPLGRAMLYACIDDAIAAGHQVYTVAAARAGELPDACRIIPTGSSEWLNAFKDGLSVADAVLLIAPETGGILQSLSALVEDSGRLLLGSSSAAVSMAGDKFAATAALRDHGCKTPATECWPLHGPMFNAKQPWILKPRRGAGCAGIYLMDSPQRIDLPYDDYIVQEFIAGTPASVAMVIGKSNYIVLSVNSQNMTFDRRARYNGGSAPLVHPLSQKAAECAGRILQAIPGLRGYVGVDVVLSDSAVYVIEVNPRITFTYCGLRRIASENLMQSIVEAAVGASLNPVPLTGSVEFDATGRIVNEIHPERVR